MSNNTAKLTAKILSIVRSEYPYKGYDHEKQFSEKIEAALSSAGKEGEQPVGSAGLTEKQANILSDLLEGYFFWRKFKNINPLGGKGYLWEFIGEHSKEFQPVFEMLSASSVQKPEKPVGGEQPPAPSAGVNLIDFATWIAKNDYTCDLGQFYLLSEELGLTPEQLCKKYLASVPSDAR